MDTGILRIAIAGLNLDLAEFAKRLGLDPKSPATRTKHMQWRQAGPLQRRRAGEAGSPWHFSRWSLAMTDVSADDHVHGIWFCSDHATVDWMCEMFRHAGKWRFQYRFRYYAEDSTDPWDDRDRKSWYAGTAESGSDAERDKMIAVINMVAGLTEIKMRSRYDFVLLDCRRDDPKFFSELASRPWAHAKRIPVEASCPQTPPTEQAP